MNTASTLQPSNFYWWQTGLCFGVVVVLQIILARRNAVEKETRRRWQHALTGQVLVAVSYVLPISICLFLLTLGALALALATCTDWYRETFGPLLRPHELESLSLPGAFYFLVGTAMVAAVFDLNTARYAVLCLSWADPMAAWIGQGYPQPRFTKGASVAGCSACFATAFVLGIAAFDFSVPKALVGSMACTVAEALPWFNDNLTIPLVTAAALQLYDNFYSS